MRMSAIFIPHSFPMQMFMFENAQFNPLMDATRAEYRVTIPTGVGGMECELAATTL